MSKKSGAETARVIEVVQQIMGGSNRVQVDLNDPQMAEIAPVINKARVRLDLSMKAGITIDTPNKGTTITFSRLGAVMDSDAPSKSTPAAADSVAPEKPKSRPKPKRYQHTYVPPMIAKDIMDALLDDASLVLWFEGQTGTGKTVLAHYLSSELDMELYSANS